MDPVGKCLVHYIKEWMEISAGQWFFECPRELVCSFFQISWSSIDLELGGTQVLNLSLKGGVVAGPASDYAPEGGYWGSRESILKGFISTCSWCPTRAGSGGQWSAAVMCKSHSSRRNLLQLFLQGSLPRNWATSLNLLDGYVQFPMAPFKWSLHFVVNHCVYQSKTLHFCLSTAPMVLKMLWPVMVYFHVRHKAQHVFGKFLPVQLYSASCPSGDSGGFWPLKLGWKINS